MSNDRTAAFTALTDDEQDAQILEYVQRVGRVDIPAMRLELFGTSDTVTATDAIHRLIGANVLTWGPAGSLVVQKRSGMDRRLTSGRFASEGKRNSERRGADVFEPQADSTQPTPCPECHGSGKPKPGARWDDGALQGWCVTCAGRGHERVKTVLPEYVPATREEKLAALDARPRNTFDPAMIDSFGAEGPESAHDPEPDSDNDEDACDGMTMAEIYTELK